MDEFKKYVQGKQLLLVSGELAACCLILLSRNFDKVKSTSDFLNGFVQGFQGGAILALFGFMTFYFFRNVFAMRNPERLKRLYISETDERKLLIMQKSGSIGMNIVMYGLAVGTAVAGNFDNTVFFTLLVACLFVALVRGSLKLYYYKKY